MATVDLAWDSTAVAASGNALSQIAYKRIKTVGGAYSSSGFSPANPLSTGANATTATVTPNKIYQFKVEANCVLGGPTPNSDGLKEQIVFECLPVMLSATNTTITIDMNLTGTDFTKVWYYLKKQSDNSDVADFGVINVGGVVPHTFSGLDPSEDYYFEVVYYTDIDAVEVLSNDAAYLNARCGGNISGYQISTASAPSTVIIHNGLPGMTITNITNIAGFSLGGSVTLGGTALGDHTGGTFAVCVNLSGSPSIPGHLTLYKNNIVQHCIASGAFSLSNCFSGVSYTAGVDELRISLETGPC